MVNNIARIALTLAALAHSGAAVAADADAGKEKSTQCAACHGPDGKAVSAQFPTIAGQYKSYLVQSLKQYRDGQRDNAVMASFVANLSDQDIADLAAYYASQPGLKILPSD